MKRMKQRIDEFCGMEEIDIQGQIIYYGMFGTIGFLISSNVIAKLILGL